MKPNEIALLVNNLVLIAQQYAGHQQLRQRISQELVPKLQQEPICKTCGGSKVDPGGLPICRDCGHPVPQAAQTLMDEAIAAGDGTLHSAVDHWQKRALAAEALINAKPAQDEREAFETWFISKGKSRVLLSRNAQDGYAIDWVKQWYEIWQARAALSTPPMGMVEQTKLHIKEIATLNRQIALLDEQIKGTVWRWQNDGRDSLETMGNTMGVLIHASDLRALLSAQPMEGDALDARRYRWLRGNYHTVYAWGGDVWYPYDGKLPDRLDNAIDAAIAAMGNATHEQVLGEYTEEISRAVWLDFKCKGGEQS